MSMNLSVLKPMTVAITRFMIIPVDVHLSAHPRVHIHIQVHVRPGTKDQNQDQDQGTSHSRTLRVANIMPEMLTPKKKIESEMRVSELQSSFQIRFPL